MSADFEPTYEEVYALSVANDCTYPQARLMILKRNLKEEVRGAMEFQDPMRLAAVLLAVIDSL